jgi:hypothetical protein
VEACIDVGPSTFGLDSPAERPLGRRRRICWSLLGHRGSQGPLRTLASIKRVGGCRIVARARVGRSLLRRLRHPKIEPIGVPGPYEDVQCEQGRRVRWHPTAAAENPSDLRERSVTVPRLPVTSRDVRAKFPVNLPVKPDPRPVPLASAPPAPVPVNEPPCWLTSPAALRCLVRHVCPSTSPSCVALMRLPSARTLVRPSGAATAASRGPQPPRELSGGDCRDSLWSFASLDRLAAGGKCASLDVPLVGLRQGF